MADITVRRNSGQMAPAAEWDPFRAMRDLVRWDPFREMSPIFRAEPAGFSPDVDVKESKEGFLFHVDLPGFKSEDIQVQTEGAQLRISGKREAEKEEKTDTYYARERSYGSFLRTFTLPQSADTGQVKADLRDGVLMISVGKRPAAQARAIPIEGAAKVKS